MFKWITHFIAIKKVELEILTKVNENLAKNNQQLIMLNEQLKEQMAHITRMNKNIAESIK